MSHKASRGAVLPAILGVLTLIFVISGTLIDSVLVQHKTNNAYKAHVHAESLAEFALQATEKELLSIAARPKVTQSITTRSANQTQVLEGKVWSDLLSSYNLVNQRDVISNDELDWEGQPVQWWQTYANKYSRNLSATSVQTAYSIVEEYQEDFSGSDLGQARDHFSGPSKVLYQVTARGDGGSDGVSRVRSIVAQTFR